MATQMTKSCTWVMIPNAGTHVKWHLYSHSCVIKNMWIHMRISSCMYEMEMCEYPSRLIQNPVLLHGTAKEVIQNGLFRSALISAIKSQNSTVCINGPLCKGNAVHIHLSDIATLAWNTQTTHADCATKCIVIEYLVNIFKRCYFTLEIV